MSLTALTTGAVAAGGLFALDRLAVSVVRPTPRDPDDTLPDLGIAHEDLTIPSGDHRLRGWLLHPRSQGRRPLVLLAHGWNASYRTLLQLAEPLVASGYQILLFDVRGHGRNEALPYVTVRHFRDDVAAAVRFAAERFPDRARVVVGHSMGGAAAVLAAEAGAPVHGIVTIAAPADVLEVTAEYLRDRGLPGGVLVVALLPFWWPRVGGTFREFVPERKIGLVRQPVLVIQPESDRRVGLEHAERLAKAAGVPVHLIAGAGHTNVLSHPETLGRIVAFVEAVEAVEASERESPGT